MLETSHKATGPRAGAGRIIFRAISASVPVRWLFWLIDSALRGGLRIWGHWRREVVFPYQGADCVCHWNSEIKYPERIRLGRGVIIGVNAVLGGAGGITLGDNVRISRDVMIETAGLDFSTGEPPYHHVSGPIVVEDGVWIGARAMILGNVTVGRNAVIAAGAIVTRDVAPGTLVAGAPARPIRGIS